MDFDQTHFRFYTLTCQKLGKSSIEVLHDLQSVWKDAAPSLRTIQRWMKDFNDGTRMELGDAPRSGRPRATRTDEFAQQIASLINEDPHLSSRDLSDLLDCNQSSVARVLRDDLGMRWVCSVWVPHELTDEPVN